MLTMVGITISVV